MSGCPKCDRPLVTRVSKTAKNPGRSFQSCQQEAGGCGFFRWCAKIECENPDEAPLAKRIALLEDRVQLLERVKALEARVAELEK